MITTQITSISVIIPTYNRANHVGEAIDSVLRQDPPATEVIVIDDGSTDATQEILSRYGSQIIQLRQENKGAAAARNLGLARAKGDWVTFLDSDDLWLEGRLALLHRDLKRASSKDVVLHVADLRMTGEGYRQNLFELRGWSVTDSDTEQMEDYFSRAMSGISPCSSAVRSDVAREVGGFPVNFPIGEDIYFFSVVSLIGPAIFSDHIVAEARRIPGDEVAAVDIFRDDPIKAYTVSQERFDRLSEIPMTKRQKKTLQHHKCGNLFNLARAQAAAGQGSPRATLLRMMKEHPNTVKALLKSLPPMLLGHTGYQIFGRKGKGFTRVR